ncbi:MAG: hypothetical protein Q9167_001662 [Letrouitia subvulpina]
MSSAANRLKEEGNTYFRDGDYTNAEMLYSKAIQQDSSNPKLFTNRAMARIQLRSFDACIDDCSRAINLDPKDIMKPFFLLAQAQLALRHPNEALQSALTAYEECLKTNSPSTRAVCNLVLQAKKEKWEVRERERVRGRNELFREVETLLREHAQEEIEMLGEAVDEEENEESQRKVERKVEELQSLFAIADQEGMKRRTVPDWIIDNISFAVMYDPVVTKTGNSYERSTLLEHLKRSPTDPLTREPLTVDELRPNLALKEACELFLRENGWAVDW